MSTIPPPVSNQSSLLPFWLKSTPPRDPWTRHAVQEAREIMNRRWAEDVARSIGDRLQQRRLARMQGWRSRWELKAKRDWSNLMFHVYVDRTCTPRIDLGRAQFLMDKTLLRESIAAMVYKRDNNPIWDEDYGPQWIWEDYCKRHLVKYGLLFRPDVEPDWTLFLSS